jgi:hypothetical protein
MRGESWGDEVREKRREKQKVLQKLDGRLRI